MNESIEEIVKKRIKITQRTYMMDKIPKYLKDEGYIPYDLEISEEWVGTVLINPDNSIVYVPCRRKEVRI